MFVATGRSLPVHQIIASKSKVSVYPSNRTDPSICISLVRGTRVTFPRVSGACPDGNVDDERNTWEAYLEISRAKSSFFFVRMAFLYHEIQLEAISSECTHCLSGSSTCKHHLCVYSNSTKGCSLLLVEAYRYTR